MEHLTFKGTARFPSTRAISEAIEGVGGSFNAATDRESTVYWVRVPRRVAERAMEVIGELIVRPSLDEKEIDNERGVIIEEIRSYLDDPAEYSQILFQQAMFGDGPLGREICGDEAGIRALPASTIHDFWSTMYRPGEHRGRRIGRPGSRGESSTSCTGTSGPATGSSRASSPRRSCRRGSASSSRAATRRQAHIVVGVPALQRDHPDSWTLSVMNAILGDGMSSRLFLTVREERGLAYDVSSGVVDYADSGALAVSAGVDPERLKATLDAILLELARLRDEPVPDDELAKAKAYISGGLELRMEETRHLASWVGGQEALHDRVLTLEEALDELGRVDAAGIQRLAGRLFTTDALRLVVVAAGRAGRGLDKSLRLP